MPDKPPPERTDKPRGSPPSGRGPNPRATATALALVLTFAAVLTGAAGVFALVGAGGALLFLSACFAAPAAIIVKGLMSGG